MGFVEFLIVAFVIVGAAWLAIWALGYFLPGHPAIVDKLIWGVALLILIVLLLRATGLVNYDPKIPHV